MEDEILRQKVKAGYAKEDSWKELAGEVGLSHETLRKFADGGDIGGRARTKLEVWASGATAPDQADERLADWLGWLSILARRGLLPGLQMEHVEASVEEDLADSDVLAGIASGLEEGGAQEAANG